MSFFRFCLFSLITYYSSAYIFAGGLKVQPVNDPQVQEFAQKAMAIINAQNVAYNQVLVRVLSARSQIVAGTNYEIELLVGHTECNDVPPGQAGLVGDCSVDPSNAVDLKVYTITVWSKPWENFEEIKIKDVKNYTS